MRNARETHLEGVAELFADRYSDEELATLSELLERPAGLNGRAWQSGRADLNRGPRRAGRVGFPARARASSRSGGAIGARGFEPRTSPTRTARATRLRHAPMRSGV